MHDETRPYTEWTLKEADAAIAAAIKEVGEDGFDENRLFVEEGDHWQKGLRWVGPLGDASIRETVLAAIERQFTPRDAIGEVLDRVANALLKTEPDISFVPLDPGGEDGEPTKQQQARAEEMVRRISAWWDRVKLWELAGKAARRSRWARRGALRVWLPPGFLVGDALPKNLPFEEALERLQLMAPSPDAAMVHINEETQKPVGIYLFDRNDKKHAELWFIGAGEKATLRIVSDGGKAQASSEDEEADDEEYSLDLGGRIPIAEMRADLLIDDAVRRQQDRLNFVETVMVRVMETAGFPERYTTNAMPHGQWSKVKPVDSPPLETTVKDGVSWYLVAAPRTFGASIMADLRGIRTDDEGTVASPGVIFKEPTDPDFAIKSSRHAYQTILETCRQAHILITGDATASGVSRQEARADFEDDLSNMKGPLEGLLRDIIEVAIAWAGEMSSEEPDFLDQFRCVVNLKVNSGPITPEEMSQNNQNVKDGMLSQESGMAANGVEDVAAETERLRAQPESQLALREKQITIMQQLVLAGSTWEAAAKIALIEDPELLAAFKALDAAAEEQRARKEAEDDEIERALRDDPEPVPVPA